MTAGFWYFYPVYQQRENRETQIFLRRGFVIRIIWIDSLANVLQAIGPLSTKTLKTLDNWITVRNKIIPIITIITESKSAIAGMLLLAVLLIPVPLIPAQEACTSFTASTNTILVECNNTDFQTVALENPTRHYQVGNLDKARDILQHSYRQLYPGREPGIARWIAYNTALQQHGHRVSDSSQI